ncbi:amidohydrolase family protein [Pseudarthrobacter sp. SL88]|uniref:amidohydrolase family protein n=1 Tax=Pseudarthrobacter sp. SL88 TaxID=2994666 RepID=UPI002DD4443D|nr:amidohydrolase family protein [Pseudarthrobacter sp. SL88]
MTTTRKVVPMNIPDLVAIDMHVHIEADGHGHTDMPEDFREAARKHFRTSHEPLNVDSVAAHYRERNMAAVVFTVDHESQTGHPPISNREIARQAAAHPDVLIPFASINPSRGEEGVREAKILVKEFGVKGFKFHPNLQGFFPNDPLAYPLYKAIQELGVPALFHTGQSGIGSGMPGSGGIRLKYSNPIVLDDVAVDFPDLKIIMAHPSFPWQDEALAVAARHTNVYIDLSGWSPKYFPPQLVQYANSLLRTKVLFGSDYPMIPPDRWIADFENLPIKPEVRPLIMRENAIRLLGLAGA